MIAAIAEHLGLVAPDSLPRPVRGLDPAARPPARARVAEVVADLDLRA